MTIFVILLPAPQPKLADAIKAAFPEDSYCVNDTQWLVSSSGTVLEITARVGIYDAKNPDMPTTGSAMVFAISSYHGRAPTVIWDWIKSKLEAKANG